MKRQALLDYLAEHQPATIFQMTEHFGVTRQSVRDALSRCLRKKQVRKGEPVPAQWGGAMADTWRLALDVPLPEPVTKEYVGGPIVETALANRCWLAIAWARPADAQGQL